jgi:outer membrane lipase/esterase
LPKPSLPALSAALFSGLLAGAPVRAEAASPPPFTALVVFGDSLSDSGNAGRFADGPVWVEHLARRIGVALLPSRLGGTNHAIGGARAQGGPNDLRAQADALLAARHGGFDPQALYVVYGGGNDLLAAGHAPDQDDTLVRATATAIGGIVADLGAAGASDILVPNLPDIGLTPALRAAGPAAQAAARALTRAYNAALEAELARVAAGHRSMHVHRLDVFALAERVVADPAAAGFRDIRQPCLGALSCEGMLFWDDVHPTTLAHARLAAAAIAVFGGEIAGRTR